MVTEVVEKYPRTTKGLKALMKTVQRELEDCSLKVELLSGLLVLVEKLDNGRKEPIGRE